MSFFPSSVPTALQLLDARNNKSVTLSAAINDTVTTIPVVDTSSIPTAGYLTFEDGSNEVIVYTGTTPTSLTGVTRGTDGTTASSHSNGGTIGMWGNAKYHNILKDEIVAIAQNISDRIGLSATQLLAPNGTVSLPSYSFAGDPDTGLFIVSANNVGMAAGGVRIAEWQAGGFIVNSGQLRFLAGSAAAPGLAFDADLNTGIYSPLADNIGISTAGILRWTIDSNGTMYAGTTQGIQFPAGSAATPAVNMVSDTNTGIYFPSADAIGFSAGGALRVRIDSFQMYISDGSANTPGIAFINDDNTGLYRPGADQIYFSTGGIVRMGIDSAGNVYNPGTYYTEAGSAASPAITFNSDTNTGIYRIGADSIGFTTGGVLRVTIDNSGLTVNSGTLAGTFTFADGSAASPSITFGADLNTGIYRIGADHFGFATNGTLRWQITSAGELAVLGGANNQLLASAGTAAAPAYSFNVGGATDTGFYSISADEIGFSAGGVLRASLSTAAFNLEGSTRFFTPDGSAASPVWSFGGDQDTGIFRQGSNVIGISTGGTARWFIDQNGTMYSGTSQGIQHPDGSAGTPSMNFTNDTDTGFFRQGSNAIGVSSGGTEAFRFQTTGASDGVQYTPFVMFAGNGFGGSGINSFNIAMRTTASVSTSATVIGGTTYGLIIVGGYDGSNVFTDLLIDNYNQSPTVVASRNGGSPAARTYSTSGDQLTLAMASGTYRILVTEFVTGLR